MEIDFTFVPEGITNDDDILFVNVLEKTSDGYKVLSSEKITAGPDVAWDRVYELGLDNKIISVTNQLGDVLVIMKDKKVIEPQVSKDFVERMETKWQY